MLRLISEIYDSVKSLLWYIVWQLLSLGFSIAKNIAEIGVDLFKLIKG
jgi:hypothetical protein